MKGFWYCQNLKFRYWNKLCLENNFKISHKIVEGGNTRFQSVKNGLEKVDNDSVVAIHDGVRPLISKNLINTLVKEVEEGIGVIPVVPLTDSIRKIEGEYSKHIDRNNVFKVQTPQCFLSSEIKRELIPKNILIHLLMTPRFSKIIKVRSKLS